MSLTLVYTAAGLGLLFLGGDTLIRGATTLATRFGVSPLAIGLTVVAFGTSTPELIVSVDAAIAGANDIALGNIVGSNIANISLILGMTALLRPTAVEAKIVFVDAPIMILVSLALIVVLVDGGISRVDGGLLLLGLVAYTAYTFFQAKRESEEVREEFASAAPPAPANALLGGVLVIAGLLMLGGGGHLLVISALDLAVLLGISQATIGLTIVAVGTSLPELATSVIAALRGRGDIAIGNVIGSNIFNILGILGVTALIRPLSLGEITWIDLWTMIGLACVVTGLIYTRLELVRSEGALLLLGFILYTVWLTNL